MSLELLLMHADDGHLTLGEGLPVESALNQPRPAASDRCFDLEPTEAEAKEAQRLAKKFGAGAVIIGHTHAVHWKEDSSAVYANSGTWIWLMRLPSPDAPDTTWADFLQELQRNPGLEPARQQLAELEKRFTAVMAEPAPQGGAKVALVQWEHPEAHPRTLRELQSSYIPRAA